MEQLLKAEDVGNPRSEAWGAQHVRAARELFGSFLAMGLMQELPENPKLPQKGAERTGQGLLGGLQCELMPILVPPISFQASLPSRCPSIYSCLVPLPNILQGFPCCGHSWHPMDVPK